MISTWYTEPGRLLTMPVNLFNHMCLPDSAGE